MSSEESQIMSKKRKGKEIANENESKKRYVPFEKIWSNEDEVVLLEGTVRFVEEKGMEPNANLQLFYNFVSASLQGDYNKSQISEKLRRLKKKYLNNSRNGKSNFGPHEKAVFDLSNTIWKQRFEADVSAKIVEFVKSSNLMKNYTHLVPSEAVDKKWLQVAKAELELLVTKYEIVNEAARLLIQALNSNHVH